MLFRPTRRSQPYRQGQGPPGPAQEAMQMGQPLYGQNPQDISRATQKMSPLAAAMQKRRNVSY